MNAHVHFGRTGLSQEVHDRSAGGATNNRVIDEYNPLPFEHFRQRVELERHSGLTKALIRLDEGPPDVAVLDQGLGVRDAALLGVSDCGRRR